jgi:hypothetical protein
MSLWVIAYCVGLSLLTEVTQYLLIYRTQSFQTLKSNLEKHAKKLDEAKLATGKSLKKKQARLDNWRDEAGKQVVALNYKTGMVVSAPLAPFLQSEPPCSQPPCMAFL